MIMPAPHPKGIRAIEQYERARRWYQYYQEIRYTTKKNGDMDKELDIILSFFMNCYHIKDWIKVELEPSQKSDVEEFVSKNVCLTICADIANGAKHLQLDKPRSSYPDIPLRQCVYVDESAEVPRIIGASILLDDGSDDPKDLFDIGGDCLEVWRIFLEDKGWLEKSP